MSVNLITGNLFSPIQASQDSDYQAGTFGEKTQILNVGSKMAVSIVDNSTIRCEDGVLVTKEGRRVQVDNGDVVEWTIPTGTQGTTSYYIVGFRLYTDDESAQLCDTFVQSMPSESATITEDTFRDGAVEIFVSVARVVQNGITLESVESLVPVATTLEQAKEDISQINSDLTDYSEFTISVGGDTETISIQKCYKKGNKIHIEFMASRSSDAVMYSIWGIIPSQYRPTQNIRTGIMSRSDVNFTVSCGCVIESSTGFIQNVSYNSIPADTTMVFYIEYPIN